MRRVLTPKLLASALLSASCVYLALITGRAEMIAVAAPLAVAAVAGAAWTKEPELSVRCSIDRDRCLEGDHVVLRVTIDAVTAVGDVLVMVAVPPGFADPDGSSARTIDLSEGETRTLDVRLEARRWGLYKLGIIGMRVNGPGRYVVWEAMFDRSQALKVFPYLERIRKGVRPPQVQVYSGNYVSRVAGDGIEFAQVRPFQPGDRVRSVNWRVTTRRDELHVNVFHPERNADVVVFLDTFGDYGSTLTSSLEMSVRGAAGVVRHYLAHRDRVGLVAFGGEVRWLTASMGATQIYRIVDVLLESRALFSYAWKGIEHLPHGTLPPGALVIAFSPLVDERSITALTDISNRGFPLLILDTLPVDEVDPRPGLEGELAHRVWRLHRRALHTSFSARGVPVVGWHDEANLDAAFAAIPSAGVWA